MKQLDGKTAIVAGASKGIGRAIALLFAKEGARLVLSARGGEPLGALATEIEASGGAVSTITGDVRDEACAKALVSEAENRFGGLDIAVHNAGKLGPLCPALDHTVEDWQDVIDVNLTAAFLGAKHQVPAMLRRGGGSLILVSSFVGVTAGIPGLTAYAAAKAGLTGLTKNLAAEYGPQGVRVNALLPGGTDTEMAREFADTDEARAHVAGMHALGRTADPAEIAQAALSLATDASSFVTGHSMLVDGGVSIKKA
jgi:NAD(P)-dependent dehydrogenase (short-subunit alcohol dehydrogenase family)